MAEARKRAVTFIPSQLHRKPNTTTRPIGAEPLDEHGFRKWTQPPSIAASHAALPGESADHQYQRMYTGNLFQRAEAPPTAQMLTAQKLAWSSSFQDLDVNKARMVTDGQAAAQQRRLDAQDADRSFQPYFKHSGLIPKWETEEDKLHKDQVYASARSMRPEHESPREEHLPRPRSATMPTFKSHHNYLSPFYPRTDAEDLHHTSLAEAGIARGGAVGSGVFNPLRKRPLRKRPTLSTVFETPYPPMDEGVYKQAAMLAAQNIEAQEVQAQTFTPRQTPRKANPGLFAAVTAHPAHTRTTSENKAAIEATGGDTAAHKSPHRSGFPFGFSHKSRRLSEATARFPSMDVGRHSNVQIDGSYDGAAVVHQRKRNIKTRAATTASSVAHILHMGKLAQDLENIAAQVSLHLPPPVTPRKPPMRKRAMTAAAHASHHLAKKATGVMHRRRYSDLEKDLMGNNRPRVTKKERAPKNWDPAKPEFQYPHFRGPPTPGRPATELFDTPDREIKEIIRKDPVAAQRRLTVGWHPTHDTRISRGAKYDNLLSLINEHLVVEMTDDETDEKVVQDPAHNQRLDKHFQKKESQTEKERIKEAERNAKILSMDASKKEDVLSRDINDVFGEHSIASRNRSGSMRRRSGSIKSGHSVNSFKSFISQHADFRKWRPLTRWKSGSKKIPNSSPKTIPSDDDMHNADESSPVGKVDKIASANAKFAADLPQISPTRATISGERPEVGTPLTPSHSRASSAPGILKTPSKKTPKSGSSAISECKYVDPGSPTPAPRPRLRGPTVMFQPIIAEQQYRLDAPTATIGDSEPPVYGHPPPQYPYNLGDPGPQTARSRRIRRNTGRFDPLQYDGDRSPKRRREGDESDDYPQYDGGRSPKRRREGDDLDGHRSQLEELSPEDSFDTIIRKRTMKDENDAKERRRYSEIVETWGRLPADGAESIPQADGCGMSTPIKALKRKIRGPDEVELAERSEHFQRRRFESDANEGHLWAARRQIERQRTASYNAWVAAGTVARQREGAQQIDGAQHGGGAHGRDGAREGDDAGETGGARERYGAQEGDDAGERYGAQERDSAQEGDGAGARDGAQERGVGQKNGEWENSELTK